MSRKLAVIGMGNVGSTIANNIVSQGLADDLVLIDTNHAKVNADAMDLKDAMPNLAYHTNITVNDYSALADADVIISSLGHIKAQLSPKHYGDRFVEFKLNTPEVRQVGAKIKQSGFHGILEVITNPVDVMTNLYQQVTGFPKNRVIGTGTLLDSARMKKAVGAAFHIDPRSVRGFNLGEHGNSQFTAWSTVKVMDQPVTKFAKQKGLDLKQLNDRIKVGGYTVFKGKHCTQFGIAAAALRLANIIMNNANTEVPVSNYRDEYGTYLSCPVIVNQNGVAGHVHLDLTDVEKQKLAKSAQFIKNKVSQLK